MLEQDSSRSFIELLPDEKMLTFQRQHIISLVPIVLFHLLICAVLATGIYFLFTTQFIVIPSAYILYLSLTSLSLLALLGTFTCMKWYYRYYIITSKRIIIRHFFKIIGVPYYNEVFIRKGTQLKVLRVSTSIFTDMLDIEDVYIQFRANEMPLPYIFPTPQDPGALEKAVYEAYEE